MNGWDSIEERYGPALKRVAASYAPPGPTRADLAQEIALALWRAMPKFRGEASERTYVLRIAHNVGLRHAMRRRASAAEPFEEQVADAPSPEDVAASRQRSERLLAAIRTLPLSQRQALTLALEGLTHAEIGAVLDIRENAVAVRLHRARQRLAEILEAS